MDTRLRTALVVLAAMIAGAAITARAEPTLRYNYDYVCNRGLRIVVGHCRHDSDLPGVAPTPPEEDYCQIYYPDRPKTGGIEAMETVLRGNLIQDLQACGALGAATSGSNGKQNTAAAAPPRTASPAEAPSKGATPASPRPTRPGAADTQAGPGEQTQTVFCDQILRLRSLAPQGFKSIDLGPMKGEDAEIHATSLHLITSPWK